MINFIILHIFLKNIFLQIYLFLQINILWVPLSLESILLILLRSTNDISVEQESHTF